MKQGQVCYARMDGWREAGIFGRPAKCLFVKHDGDKSWLAPLEDTLIQDHKLLFVSTCNVYKSLSDFYDAAEAYTRKQFSWAMSTYNKDIAAIRKKRRDAESEGKNAR